jgi:hypothetical protein
MLASIQRYVQIDRVARLIADLFTPPVVALPVLLAIAIGTASPRQVGIWWWITTTIGLSAIPFGFILLGARRGRYDIHITQRDRRLIPLLVGLGSTILTSVVLLLEHASRPFMATIVSVIASALVFTMITVRWKISFHVGAITGAVTVLTMIFGPSLLLLTPLIFLVAWARWILRAHTPAQILAGALLASVIPWLVFTIGNV